MYRVKYVFLLSYEQNIWVRNKSSLLFYIRSSRKYHHPCLVQIRPTSMQWKDDLGLHASKHKTDISHKYLLKKGNYNVTWKVAMGVRSPWRVRLKPRGRPECAGWRLRCLRGRRHTGPERGEGPGLTTRCPARTSAQCGSEDVPPTSANSPTTKQHCQCGS